MKIIFVIFLLLSVNGYSQSNNALGVSTDKDFQKPILGWSSWNNYRININEQLIKSQTDAIINLDFSM